MCIDNCIRYSQYSPHNKSGGRCICNSVQKEARKCPRCGRSYPRMPALLQIPTQEEKRTAEEPQNASTPQNFITAPETAEVHNGGSSEPDPIMNTVKDIGPPDAADQPGDTPDEFVMSARDEVPGDVRNTPAVSLDEGVPTEEDNLNIDFAPILPLFPEEVSLDAEFLPVEASMCFEQHADQLPAEQRQAVNQLMDTAGTKSCDRAQDCGLLHFRQWWERHQVDISVYGKLISGTPIFIEEDTVRVINDNYSYFIPLRKVDYIRTPDGLRSSFHLPEDGPDNG